MTSPTTSPPSPNAHAVHPPSLAPVGTTTLNSKLPSTATSAPGATLGSDQPQCRSADLRLAAGPTVSPMTGQNPVPLTMTNVGPAPCVLGGYPTVTFFDAQNNLVPFTVVHGDQEVTSQPPQSVVIMPGHAGYVLVNKYRCDLGDVSAATVIDVVPPGQSQTLHVSSSYPFCGPGDPGSVVAVSPIEPDLQSVFATQSSTSSTAASTTCQPGQLAVSVSGQEGAVGHGQQIVSLSNKGPADCTLYGFPGLGLLNGSGQSVKLTVTRATAAGFLSPAVPETTLTLTPGGEPAAFGMEWINGPSTGTYSLQVTPPNDTGYLVVPNQVDVFASNHVSVTPVAPPSQLK